MNRIISTALLLLTFSGAVAQQSPAYARVGLPCPDLHFNEVSFYNRKKIAIADFKGQWLILDFWNRHCGTCIERMPVADSLQKNFKNQVKVILVGYTGSQYTHHPDNAIRVFYKDIRKRLHIDLPIAYDSIAFHRLAIGACPYIIIVDPKGIVRAVTTKIESHDMMEFLAGRQPVLEKATNRKGI
jgi:thiol-disulfide isomerase/thioredoxin